MIYWDGYILTYHTSDVKLYSILELDEELNDAILLSLVKLSKAHADAYATIADFSKSSNGAASISTVIQSDDSRFGFASIACHPHTEKDKRIIISDPFWADLTSLDKVGEGILVMRYCVGSTGGRMSFMIINQRKLAPNFYTSPVRTIASNDASPEQSEHIPFSRIGFPLPFLVSSMDFDDGWGQIAIGVNSGEISVGSFIEWNILTSCDVELPSFGYTKGLTYKLSKVRYYLPICLRIAEVLVVSDRSGYSILL